MHWVLAQITYRTLALVQYCSALPTTIAPCDTGQTTTGVRDERLWFACCIIEKYTSSFFSWKMNDKYSLLMHCIKIKSPAKFLLNEQYVFVGEIFIFFVCYHGVPKRHSQLDYGLNGLWNKIKLKTTRWRWCFLKIFTMTMSLESFDQLV